MSSKPTEDELWRFQEQWAPTVMLFCRLCTGDAQAANDATTHAFEEYFSAGKPLHLDHVPTSLMSLAFEECQSSAGGIGTDVQSEFESAVLSLEPDERAIFILHGVLDLWLPWVAAITRIPFETVNPLWTRALINLRLSTVRDDYSQFFADCAMLFQSQSEAFA